MASAKETRERYVQISNEKNIEINTELVHILKQEENNYIEDTNTFELKLHANKKTDRNEMYRKKINATDVEILCITLTGNIYITELDLGYNAIQDAGGIIIGKFLEDTTTLGSLNLSYNDICARGAGAIAKGLQLNFSLKVLKLDGNKIGIYGGLAIAGTLQVNETLEEIYINNTEQGTQSLIAFTTVLKFNTFLKVFDIGRPILYSQQEETTVHFAKMLEVNYTLTDIHLSKHGIRNFGAERLVEHLIYNRALIVLDLSCNSISRDGMKHISIFLESNPPLQLLNLGYNRAEDDGAIFLSNALARDNHSLLTLVLCSNSLTDKGLCALAKCLDTNKTLKQLYIWGNKIETKASKAFLDLTEGDNPRLAPDDTDVRGYIVDDVPYLARVDSPF